MEPDLNITLSQVRPNVGDQLNITCIGDKPRYASQLKTNFPVHPFETLVFFNGSLLPACPRSNGKRIVCTRTVFLDKTATNLTAACRARNVFGCRIKSLLFTIMKRPIRKYIYNLYTYYYNLNRIYRLLHGW